MNDGLDGADCSEILSPNVIALITAAQAIRRDARVYGLAGATNHPAVRCEVKGLCLKHWYDLCAALEYLPNAERIHGGVRDTKSEPASTPLHVAACSSQTTPKL